MECGQVHWQAGQGDRERGGGEEGLGLGQWREEAASWVTKGSLHGDAVTEGEALPKGEKEIGETGIMRGSDRLGAMEEGTKVRMAGVVAVSEGTIV